MQQAILDALRSGDAATALANARELIAAQPQDPTAHRLLAFALRLDGDREAALAAIDQAIALAPEQPSLHFERAGLLLQERQLDEAQAALARTTGLDPNQFPAYVVQGQLAIARGDLDEAERLTRTAARIAPEHPHVAALEGTLALRRGDHDRALALLAAASERSPDDPQLRHALGFAYLAKGHLAFAEQAFRGILENNPQSVPLRALVANIVRQQGRAAEAADDLAPLLDSPSAGPALQRLVGELELEAGRNERALPPLRSALAAQPEDPRTLQALLEAWRRLGKPDDARSTLDAALATHPQASEVWRARLMLEAPDSDAARDLVERWQSVAPDHVPALEAAMVTHTWAGRSDQADAVARRIIELQPGHTRAELHVVDGLLQRDPGAAVAHVQALLDKATDANVKANLRQLLGRALDADGQVDAAAALWAQLQAEIASQRLPLRAPVATGDAAWPPLAPAVEGTPNHLLLWGAPGSAVDRLAGVFRQVGLPLLADRYGPRPPTDLFQRYTSFQSLADGSADTAALIDQWRAALPARGDSELHGGTALDWLLFWDNALLHALRPHLAEAVLLVALRDPRDMLLDWLAFGSPARFALESPLAGARWLAGVLGQIADLDQHDLFPHRLVKLDDIANDAAALSQLVADVVQLEVPMAPPASLGPPHLPAGRWRAYREPLAEAFAELAPVAERLGYPED